MIARLILALLLVLGATPSAAMPGACHGDPVMAGMAMTAAPADHAPAPHQPASVDHGCIGCAALGDWLGEAVAGPRLAPAMTPIAGPARPMRGAPSPPDRRPPRLG